MKSYLSIPFIVVLSVFSSCINQVKDAGKINTRASIPGIINFQSMGLKAIASFIYKKQGEMAILYANDPALHYAKSDVKRLAPGQQFVFLRWKQQADVRWFGAKLPEEFQTMEIVETVVKNNKLLIRYQRHRNKSATINTGDMQVQKRIAYILSQQASVMP